ncbi:MAG: efflux RND transporter permease subunit, partial [Gemmatimonadota bacterium]|nr:efflux RND transporter permease subunit [Gemmatimonadota bacterium]
MIRLAIRRPVATLTITAAVAAIGVPSLLGMPLELLPDVTFPRLRVTTSWWGASPEMVEAFVTSPIEAAAQGVGGVETVSSTSYAHRSVVEVEFDRGTEMEFARLEFSERLSAFARDLPPGAGRPEVEPWVPEEFAAETEALLVYTLAGPAEPGALRDLAVEEAKPRLLAVEGVDAVRVVGGTDRVLRVSLDPDRLRAHALTPGDVSGTIAASLNVAETSSTIHRGGRELTVAIESRAAAVSDVEALVLRPARVDSITGALSPTVRLEDVGRVRVTRAEPVRLYRVDGLPAVSLYLHREAGSNAIRVVDRVAAALAELRGSLPSGHRLIEDHDGSEKIRSELTDLGARAAVAAAVVLGVLLLAFRRLRPALLAFGTIVTSVLVAAVLLGAIGVSWNLLTLAGVAMGFGLVVDNAIVVLESIESRRAAGETGPEAAGGGARRVALPILAATVTTLVVFPPFLWFQGELRAYYVPFAVTVAVVMLASLLVSFTAVPAVAARLESLGDPAGPPGPREPLPRRAYRRILGWSLARPGATAALAFLTLAGATWIFWDRVPRGATWGGFGESTFLSVRVSMPRGAELVRTDEIARRLERELATIDEVERYVTDVGREHAAIRVTFPDSLERTFVPVAVKERLVAHGHRYGGAEVRVYGYGPSFYGGGGAIPSYSVKLMGYGYRELEGIAHDLARRLRGFARIRDVDPNASGFWFERDRELEFVLAPDRAALAGHGMTVEDLLSRAAAAARGRIARDVVWLSGEEVDLSVKLAGGETADLEDLRNLVVPTRDGRPVRVGDVAGIRSRETLGRIVREDQQYQRIVAWEFRGPRRLGDRVRDAVVATIDLPPGYTIEAETSWWEYEEGERRRLALVVALAVALVFLVTAALFESLRAPLVVLAAVPLALIGV